MPRSSAILPFGRALPAAWYRDSAAPFPRRPGVPDRESAPSRRGHESARLIASRPAEGQPQRRVSGAEQSSDRHLLRDGQHDPAPLPVVHVAARAVAIRDHRRPIPRRFGTGPRGERLDRGSVASSQGGRRRGLRDLGCLQTWPSCHFVAPRRRSPGWSCWTASARESARLRGMR